MIGICFWLNGQNRDARYRFASIISFVFPKVDLLTGVAARCIKIVDKFICQTPQEYKQISRLVMKNIPQFYTE